MVVNLFIIIFTAIFSMIGWRNIESGVVWLCLLMINTVARALVASVFVGLGFVLTKYLDTLHIDNKLINFITVVSLLTVNIGLCMLNTKVDLHYMILGNPLIYWINAIIGSMAMILVVKNVLDEDGILSFFSKNSLVIMATHLPLPILEICLRMVGNIVVSNVSVRYLLTFVLTVIVEIGVIFVINKYFKVIINFDYAIECYSKLKTRINFKNS